MGQRGDWKAIPHRAINNNSYRIVQVVAYLQRITIENLLFLLMFHSLNIHALTMMLASFRMQCIKPLYLATSQFKSTGADSVDCLENGVYNNWIGGKYVKNAATRLIDVKNPAKQQALVERQVPHSTSTKAQSAIDASHAAFPEWRQVPIQQKHRINAHIPIPHSQAYERVGPLDYA